ncbi:exodeoxyribonuclease VII large subunit [Candidatus Fokinia crypta]|uniref:Exodeoxyribonuclease 7 large subunit n=1 Tax=Candidatus Fokinia crypta TaxID=1920990 RepID=A0ABZ0UNY3_9RICK|nr:exodeoxyribonuclease VII large subunit [Candidatus Fokinia cryptica]WPX97824.1 Exodeoxyribonuclease 7 large subunit [Candidatus Fokinia cryptica]
MKIEACSSRNVSKEVKIYSVTEISRHVKGLLENSYLDIKVRGEISSIDRRKGHIFIELKDSSSASKLKDSSSVNIILKVTIWENNSRNIKLSSEIKEGVEVICIGSLSSVSNSSYYLKPTSIEISGEGALKAEFEKRKKEYTEKGYFLEERKKKLPPFPRIIGVITSIQGAVIEDIVNTISQRIPTILFIFDVSVQGQTAVAEICNALQKFQSLPKYTDFELNNFIEKTTEETVEMNFQELPQPDVLIIARGGGSVSDLQTFNEEAIIEAIYHCTIPIISGIGHAPDSTLSEHVADKGVHTPTAAAEAAIKSIGDLQHARAMQDVMYVLEKKFDEAKNKLESANRTLNEKYNILERNIEKFSDKVRSKLKEIAIDVGYQLNDNCSRLESKFERISSSIDSMCSDMRKVVGAQYKYDNERIQWHKSAIIQSGRSIEGRLQRYETEVARILADVIKDINSSIVQVEHSLNMHNQKLLKFDYKDILKRGFAVVRTKDGTVIQSRDLALQESMIEIQVSDGYITAIVKDNSKSK